MKPSGGGIDHGTIMAGALDSCQDRLPILRTVGTAIAPTPATTAEDGTLVAPDRVQAV
jgi:hypothetical protein